MHSLKRTRTAVVLLLSLLVCFSHVPDPVCAQAAHRFHFISYENLAWLLWLQACPHWHARQRILDALDHLPHLHLMIQNFNAHIILAFETCSDIWRTRVRFFKNADSAAAYGRFKVSRTVLEPKQRLAWDARAPLLNICAM
jgi:hypothetical protein